MCRASARHFLDLGYPVLRLNLRGAGPSQGHLPLSLPRGAQRRSAPGPGPDGRAAGGTGLLLVGIFAGRQSAAEISGRGGPARDGPGGAVSISAPIDLDAARRCLMRAAQPPLSPLSRLARLKLRIARASALSEQRQRRILAEVETIFEFDDRILAPRIGFRRCAGLLPPLHGACPFCRRSRVPTLMIHARNDPWIPFRQLSRL